LLLLSYPFDDKITPNIKTKRKTSSPNIYIYKYYHISKFFLGDKDLTQKLSEELTFEKENIPEEQPEFLKDFNAAKTFKVNF